MIIRAQCSLFNIVFLIRHYIHVCNEEKEKRILGFISFVNAYLNDIIMHTENYTLSAENICIYVYVIILHNNIFIYVYI